MYLKTRILYLYTESPLHMGSGSGLGAVDLPIQRERLTDYPNLHSGGIKGGLRSSLSVSKAELGAVFGPLPEDTHPGNDHAGALGVGDGQILLFPVRSLGGVFAWTTCLHVLQRWQRALQGAVPNLPELFSEPAGGDEAYCYARPGVQLRGAGANSYVILEEFSFRVEDDPRNDAGESLVALLAKWLAEYTLPLDLDPYWGRQLQEKLVILRDDDFRDMVLHTTEVHTRVRLDPDTKTVKRGALWTEEHLPVDTLLYAPLHASRLRMDAPQLSEQPDAPAEEQLDDHPAVAFPVPGAQPAAEEADQVLAWLQNKTPACLQLGGDETVGRGLVRLRWSN